LLKNISDFDFFWPATSAYDAVSDSDSDTLAGWRWLLYLSSGFKPPKKI
jgi:hypothetical protein